MLTTTNKILLGRVYGYFLKKMFYLMFFAKFDAAPATSFSNEQLTDKMQ